MRSSGSLSVATAMAVCVAFTWASAVVAQDAAGTQGAAAGDEQSSMTAEQQAFMEKMRALHWVEGPTTVTVAGNSTLTVPEGYVFLQPADTKKWLEMNENLGGGTEVMVAPDTFEWEAYLDFANEGYVKDTDTIDAAALLKTLKENTDAANEERRKRGWADLHVIEWAVAPAYNPATKRLEWATLLESEGHRGTNFYTKMLGRRGYTSVQMVAEPDELKSAEAALDKVLTGYQFNAGETYAEFKEGDKVAEYGLAALIVGGAAAVATKKGFWAAMAGFLAAAWKGVAAVAVAAAAGIKSLFKKKDT